MNDETQALLPVTIPRELFDFLMGVGEIDGTSFGDLNEHLPGRFWWRALMRTAEASQSHSLPGDARLRISDAISKGMCVPHGEKVELVLAALTPTPGDKSHGQQG